MGIPRGTVLKYNYATMELEAVLLVLLVNPVRAQVRIIATVDSNILNCR